MGELYNKKDLRIAREVGIDDVIAFVNTEKLESISEEQAVMLAQELVQKRDRIFGYANNLMSLHPVQQTEV